jgi:hypothetical protein
MPSIIDITTTELEITSCCSCGVRFGVPEIIMGERRQNAGHIYCPNGHRLGWNESDADRLRKQLNETASKLTAAKCETATERAAKERVEAELKRHQKRTKNGVCPCCHRSFQNLRRHIKTKHPTFAK